MTIFVDASALIAIIAGEPDADALSDRLQADADRLCSTVAMWEAVIGLARGRGISISAARDQVRRYVETGTIRIIPMGEKEFDLAIEAFERFGKSRHPAGLNMGDCHAYACARANGCCSRATTSREPTSRRRDKRAPSGSRKTSRRKLGPQAPDPVTSAG